VAVLFIILRILWSLSAIAIIVTVLLHAAKGDGIAAIGGSAQMFASKRSAESNLDRVTWAAVAVFLVSSSLLSLGALNRALVPAPDAAPLSAPAPAPAPAPAAKP